MATFTWIPSRASLDEEPRVKSAKYGDGYEQRRPDGINSVVQKWSLSFACQEVHDYLDILAFLRQHKGSDPFHWKPPDESASILVKCPSWGGSADPGKVRNITANFEQVFG